MEMNLLIKDLASGKYIKYFETKDGTIFKDSYAYTENKLEATIFSNPNQAQKVADKMCTGYQFEWL